MYVCMYVVYVNLSVCMYTCKNTYMHSSLYTYIHILRSYWHRCINLSVFIHTYIPISRGVRQAVVLFIQEYLFAENEHLVRRENQLVQHVCVVKYEQ